MAGKAKKAKIDFSLSNILAEAEELSSACAQFHKAANLLTAASQALKKLPPSSQLDILGRMDSVHVSLYLVSVLTLDGVDTLRMASDLVPAEFVGERYAIISRIVLEHCDLPEISEGDCLVAYQAMNQKLGRYMTTVRGSADANYQSTFKRLEMVIYHVTNSEP
ncbi:MAG: hypothetical protein MPL62_08875 [Alphaproteobacteria bacterium]|nr:hypothetical protein [Alphaproteobacteria bacterium]MDA8010622.1 hypothetical protein [Alphaproteobacteria bacterium]